MNLRKEADSHKRSLIERHFQEEKRAASHGVTVMDFMTTFWLSVSELLFWTS